MLKAPLTLDMNLQLFIKLLAIGHPGFAGLSQVVDMEVKILLTGWLGSDSTKKLSWRKLPWLIIDAEDSCNLCCQLLCSHPGVENHVVGEQAHHDVLHLLQLGNWVGCYLIQQDLECKNPEHRDD